MALTTPDSVTLIDGKYIRSRRAAAYLIVDGGEAAFFDSITRYSVPGLLAALDDQGLGPEAVRYLIVSHVHLDHSAGTAELAKQCPNATVICHPRAKRHLIDPERLVEAARPIYGEDIFDKVFGEIEPVDERRVRDVDDGAALSLGERTLNVLHTPGHASHHLSVHDSATNTAFTGDAFGIAQLRLQEGDRVHVSYVCSPPDFDAEAGKESVRRILDTGAERVCVTHFGSITDLSRAAGQLYRNIDAIDAIIDDAAATGLEGTALRDYCNERALELTREELRACGLDPSDQDVYFWATTEINITTQGIAFMAERRRQPAKT